MYVTQKELSGIKSKMDTQITLANGYLENGDTENAEKAMNSYNEIKKEFVLKTSIYEAQQDDTPDADDVSKQVVKTEKPDGFVIVAKMLNGRKLSVVEKDALLANTDPATAEHGENFILPQEINTQIKELRKNRKSAKALIWITPVTALSGSDTYAKTDDGELYPLTDGDDFNQDEDIAFSNKTWNIKFYGKLIPVSNILAGAERGGLMSYLDRWFIRSAINTENKLIFAKLDTFPALPAPINSLLQVGDVLDVELDPDFVSDAVIVTNQTGFGHMTAETDAIGRPLLHRDLEDRAVLRYNGVRIERFSNSQLPNKANGNAPIYIGSLMAGLEMKEYQDLQFAVSDHVFFTKNQRALRVLEGFDLVVVDPRAVRRGEYTAPAQKVVLTKEETAGTEGRMAQQSLKLDELEPVEVATAPEVETAPEETATPVAKKADKK